MDKITKKPLVSILVPVYNVSEYLKQCMNSLIEQSLLNIEIICVNDGSTDNSLAILEEYSTQDKRIKIINKPNGGLPSARNAGLDAATGEYVGFVDADDYVDSEMYKRMYETAKKTDADIVVCGAHCFPDENNAPQWLKNVLTTRDIVYAESSMSVLFEEQGAKPFLWRNLVRKSLIDKYHFRLDESIVVGEDQAMQFKLFAKAQKTAFISDKLYNYRYTREGSIMNTAQYKDYSIKLRKHINMIDSIVKSWIELDLFSENAKMFFEWAVDFIYWDMIKVSVADRANLCNYFCDILIKNGYYLVCKQLSKNTNKFFDYMYKQSKQIYSKPKLSVALVVGNCKDYLDDCLNSILSQSMKDIEVLIYANAAEYESYQIAEKYLYSDARISLCQSEWKPISEHLNDAIASAKGDYITFIKPYDHYLNKDYFADAIRSFDDANVDLVGFIQNATVGIHEINACQCASYYSILYRLNTIREQDLLFKDYALLTGRVFFTNYCLNSRTVYNLGYDVIYRNQTLKRTAIYSDEARLILEAMLYILEVAYKNGLDNLRLKIGEMLNSENYERLITDATYGIDLNNPKLETAMQKSNADILGMLIKINKLILFTNQSNAITKTLYRFIKLRHEFLQKI